MAAGVNNPSPPPPPHSPPPPPPPRRKRGNQARGRPGANLDDDAGVRGRHQLISPLWHLLISSCLLFVFGGSRTNEILGKATSHTLHRRTPVTSKSQNILGETSSNSVNAKILSQRSNSRDVCENDDPYYPVLEDDFA